MVLKTKDIIMVLSREHLKNTLGIVNNHSKIINMKIIPKYQKNGKSKNALKNDMNNNQNISG